MHVAEQSDAQVTRETLVDEFESRHPATDDPLLAAEVVALDVLVVGFRSSLVGFAGDALEQGIDLFLGKKILAHPAVLAGPPQEDGKSRSWKARSA